MNHRLYYFHDPMCAWCWAYRPTWAQLRKSLPKQLELTSLVGGLAPDSDQLMPPEMASRIEGYWYQIEDQLGTSFNHDFWTQCRPRRSTYPACRAVIAARRWDLEESMILAIQKAYYQRAMNPSDVSVLTALSDEIGINKAQFEGVLHSLEVEQTLRAEIALTRNLNAPGFPSLILELISRGTYRHIAIDYEDHRVTLSQIEALLDTVD